MPEYLYPYIYDLTAAVIAVLFIFIGRKNGAARMIFLFVGTAAAIVAASYLSSLLSGLVFERFMREPLILAVVKALPDSKDISDLISKLLEESRFSYLALAVLGIEPSELAKFDSAVAEATERAAVTIVDSLISPLVISLLRSILFILLFLLLMLIVRLIAKALKPVNEIPVLGKVNRFFGALIGLVCAALLILVLTVPLCFAVRYLARGGLLSEKVICSGIFYRYIYGFVSKNLF